MKTTQLTKVKAEIARLTDAVAELEKYGQFHGPRDEFITSPLHTGAVRRASMDVTRALAVLRRGA